MARTLYLQQQAINNPQPDFRIIIGVLITQYGQCPPIPGFTKKHLAKNIAADSELVAKIYMDPANNPMPLERALNRLTISTLILWGDQDRLTHVSDAAIPESLMSNAKTIVMKNMGHIPMLENPELTAKYYLDFHKKKQ